MENIKNRPGKGPQVSFLKSEEYFMSPAYFDHMKAIQRSYANKANIGDGPVDYESSFKLGSITHDKIKSDVWSLGATILYAGNLKSIKSIYDTQTFEVDKEALDRLLDEFSGRYNEKNPELVSCVKKMLAMKEADRPTFQAL